MAFEWKRIFTISLVLLCRVYFSGALIDPARGPSDLNKRLQKVAAVHVRGLNSPFSTVLIGLLVAGSTINMFSLIGYIKLMGLVTKNGILQVDFANRERQRGISADCCSGNHFMHRRFDTENGRPFLKAPHNASQVTR